MDLVNAAIGFKQAQTVAQVQTAVARKLLDSQKQQGAAVVQLIQAAGEIQVQAGDEFVAAATGLGSQVDVYA